MKRLVSLFFISFLNLSLFSFTVSVTDLVGEGVGGNTNLPLPAVIKADSDWVPLFRIDISTNSTNGGSPFYLTEVTATLRSQANFDVSEDISDIAIFADAENPGSGPKWDGDTVERKTSTGYTVSGSSPWQIHMTPTTNNAIGVGTNTFYLCVKTSQNIQDGDQFDSIWLAAGQLVINIDNGTYVYDVATDIGAGFTDTMTADTVEPSFLYVYTPNSDSGTTATVENQDNDNVYSVSDDNTIIVHISLGEDTNSLNPGSYFSLNDLVEISSISLLGSGGSANKAMVYVGGGNEEYEITYQITSSTINQNTDGTNPIPFSIRVRDAAGNWSSWDSSFEVYLDSKTPDTPNLISPDNDSYISNVYPAFEWQAIDEAHLMGYALIISDVSDFSGSLNIKNLSKDTLSTLLPQNGVANWDTYNLGALVSGRKYYWAIGAEDLAGLQTNITSGRSFIYDGQAPDINWIDPDAGATLTDNTPTIEAVIGDYSLSGVDTGTIVMEIKEAGSSYVEVSPEISVNGSSFTVTYTPSPLSDGSYTVRITVSDKVGNQIQDTRTFNIDATPPTLQDSDNDGETDSTEKVSGSDYLDPSSTSGNTSFWPKDGEIIGPADLEANDNKMMFLIEDIYNTNYASGPDIDASTITISGPAGTFVFGASDSPYPKVDSSGNTDTGPGTDPRHIWNRFKCQIPVPLNTDGTDDGIYTITIIPVDNAGNIGNTVKRTFIYDSQGPVISTVTAPTEGDTANPVTFTISCTDTYGVSDKVDAVKFYLRDENFTLVSTFNMIKDTSTNNYSITFTPTQSGIFYYYFRAEDFAGNISTYPVNADNNKTQTIKIVIEDKTGPWAIIGNENTKGGEPISYVKTLVDVETSGIVKNYTDNTNPSVNDIPTIYSASNNILQATVEDETVGAKFQYKLSTSTTWTDLTTYQTATTQIWEATWDTTGLPLGTYDIRIVAWDVHGNTSTPVSLNSPSWIQVKLEKALAPQVKIDTTRNDEKVVDGGRVKDKLVLCALLPTTGNIDISTVTFQYKKQDASSWITIAVDDDPTNSSLVDVTFTFDYDDLPRYIQSSGTSIDTSTIIGVTFDCTNDTYDTSMENVGDKWTATISFPPGTYDYRFRIDFADGSSISVRDVNEQDNDGVITNSRVYITNYTAVWNLSSISEGTYYVRAVGRDHRGVEDSNPSFITVIVDKTSPSSVSITDPTESNNYLKTGGNKTLYVSVSDNDVSEVFFLYSSDNGKTWNKIANSDVAVSDGWSQIWAVPDLSNDSTYVLKAFAVDNAGNIASSSELEVLLDATDPEILSFTIDGSSDTVIELEYGKLYTWSVTTVSPDIDNLTFQTGGAVPDYDWSWSPGDKITSYTGSGTTSDPYRFSGTVLIAIDPNEDNQQETITATLEDKSGRIVQVTKTLNLKDVTPTQATISSIDGFAVSEGDKIKTADRFINIVSSLDVDDDGVLKFQYRPLGSSTWITFAEDTTPDNGDSAVFPPDGVTLTPGDYELRVLCIDDDNNPDPNPATYTVTISTTEPDIKPATIISVNNTNGTITAVEYDELVDQVKFEYRRVGDSEWKILGSDNIPDSNFGNAGNTWSSTLANLSEGVYEVRAIAQYTAGNAQADSSFTPIYKVEIKEDTAGNKLYYLYEEEKIELGLVDANFTPTYAGTKNTFVATLVINSSITLQNVSARLLISGSVDKYLDVSGSGGNWTASVDISEVAFGGTGRIIVNALDLNGNIISISKPIGIAASSNNPTPTAGRVTNVTWTDSLEHNTAMAVYPVSMPTTPSNQISLVKPIGEVWEFLLSDPEAFSESDPDGDGTLTQCTITMSYQDNELNGEDENKLGVAWWDESKGEWSAEGITGVSRDLVNNTVTFTVNHFSKFALAVIDSEPEIKFISPSDGGYAPSDPLIDVIITDKFSAIRSVKIFVDGVEQTANFATVSGHDGIDNDGNGLVDEENLSNFTTELPLNQTSSTGARYKVKAPLHLSPGTSHTIDLIATNEEGVSSSKVVSFTVGKVLSLENVYPENNPFNPLNESCRIYFTPTSEANIRIKIYDFSGKVVFEKNLGRPSEYCYDWNGRDKNNNILANGVYFVDIIAEGDSGKDTERIKIAILK